MNYKDTYNEKELLSRIAKGDEAAFEELFTFYRPRLYTAAFRTVRDVERARDIYQDIFLRVWLKRTTLSTMENFPGWLFTVARNVIYSSLKQSGRNKVGTLDFLIEMAPDPANNPAKALQEKEIQKVYMEAINRLSAKQRETYNLIKGEGLSRMEAAARMNLSPETIKWHLDQATRSIRAYCIKHLDFTLFFTLIISLE